MFLDLYTHVFFFLDWNELNSLQNVDYRELPPTSPFVFVGRFEIFRLDF